MRDQHRSSYSNHPGNKSLPLFQTGNRFGLLSSLEQDEPSSPYDGLSTDIPPPFGSVNNPISITSSPPSPAILPPRQLSSSMLSQSDFPLTHKYSPSDSLPDHLSSPSASLKTPSLQGFKSQLPGSWTAGKIESAKALEDHMRERLPYVMEASKRLQAVMGIRNEDVFPMPAPPPMPMPMGMSRPGMPGMTAVGNPVRINPALRHLREGHGIGGAAGFRMLNQTASGQNGPVNESLSRERMEQFEAMLGPRREIGGAANGSLSRDLLERLRGRSDVANRGFSREVLDRFEATLGPKREDARSGSSNIQSQEQGRQGVTPGLRESLYMHGQQPYGRQVRKELRSLTLHDITPDMRTNAFQNELLAHFEADAGRETRLSCYEVDVRALHPPQPNPGQPQAITTERWISFIIQVPIITLSNTPNGPLSAFPPNLPVNPISASWLMFAAPIRNIIAHPPSRDNTTTISSTGQVQIQEVKRLDYDFSHGGVAVFEFMDKASVLGPFGTRFQEEVGMEFLCAKGMRHYNAHNDVLDPPDTTSSENDNECNCGCECVCDHEEGKDDDAEGDTEYKGTEEEGTIQSQIREGIEKWQEAGNPAVNDFRKSKWWNEAKDKFCEDAQVWVKVREAMARGCCRVVVRVDDVAERMVTGRGGADAGVGSGAAGRSARGGRRRRGGLGRQQVE